MGEPLTSTLLVEHGDCVVPILLTVTSKLAYHVGPASADRSEGYNLCAFHFFLTENGPGRCLKNFLEAVRFILTEYGPMASHGDPIHDHL